MKKILLVLVSALVLGTSVLTSCGVSYNSIKRMQKIEEGVSNPTTKEELEEAIKKFDKRAMDLALTEGQIGIWYKILGTRYLDQQMYGKAFECFQKALAYYPDNANLYYYVAACAAILSRSTLDFEAEGYDSSAVAKQMNYLRLAESSYKRALSIDPKYYRAMYGISVLYIFELAECEKAIPYLETYLATQTRDTNGMFALARAYFVTQEYDKAEALYNKIIEINPNAEKVREAEKNKKIILDAKYAN